MTIANPIPENIPAPIPRPDVWCGQVEPGSSARNIPDGSTPRVAQDLFYEMSLDEKSSASSMSLGSVVVDYETIVSLFMHFKNFYYHHCPILNTNMSVMELYNSHRILFWTVVIIASRCHPELFPLFRKLESPYQDILARALLTPVQHIAQIQALILLCFWPLPVATQKDDPSWNYCGLLTNAAVRLGLHKSSMAGKTRNFTTKEDPAIISKTWIACYILNCSYSWYTGVTLPSRLTPVLTTPPSPSTKTESEFFARFPIYRESARAVSILENLDDPSDGAAIVQVMCKQLGSLRDEHRDTWNLEAEILALGSQLCLFSLQIENSVTEASSGRKNYAIKDKEYSQSIIANLAFTTAIRFIHNFSELASSLDTFRDGQATSSGSAVGTDHAGVTVDHSSVCHTHTRYLPKQFLLMLSLAAIMLFKAKAAYPEAIEHNNELGKNHIQIAYDLLGKWSMEKDDEPSRIQRMIEVFSRAERQHILNLRDPPQQTEALWAMPVVKDAILTAQSLRDKVGILVRNGKTISISEAQPNKNGTELNSGCTSELDNQLGVEMYMENSFVDWNFPWDLDIPLTAAQCDHDIEPNFTSYVNGLL
ncbi:hypothetical protein BP6252_04988 [Coleophoma cylindrospora]|uniref:Xylanolytic transcriptional activator regulatory domain-containing protein n=1 Tax=Coleophoma cylindrospora TaxID=1849047 RepID=A0A3D8RSG3_9HELO|nr:hypothetical protein BP6252_04988 [Coleophoma cylindrospora]